MSWPRAPPGSRMPLRYPLYHVVCRTWGCGGAMTEPARPPAGSPCPRSCRRGPGHSRLCRSRFGARGRGFGGVCLGRSERTDRARRAAGDPSLLPHLLWLLHWVMGDVMWAGRALGVLSGVAVVVFSTRLFGPWAGLWAMAQLPLLTGVLLADPALPAVALLMATLSSGTGSNGSRGHLWRPGCRVRQLDAPGGGLRRLARSPSLACTGGPGCGSWPTLLARCSGHP